MTLVDLGITTPERVADWLEISLLVSSSGNLPLDQALQLGDEELNVSSPQTSMAISVMANRAAILGDLYPFEVIAGIAIRRRAVSPLANTYATLLILTPSSVARLMLPGLVIAQMAELLEGVAQRALSNFWGPGGEAIQFAYPSQIGRPRGFDQAVVWLAGKIGVQPGRGYRPPRRRDGGVDVVAWRRFRDGRPGFPIALAQCTIQEEAFTKTTDIDVRLWATWLAMDTDPMSILVLPGTIRRAGPEWAQLTSVVTVLDRLRLVELLGRSNEPDPPDVWTTGVIGQLAAVLAVAQE
jgi:hypothetical protein